MSQEAPSNQRTSSAPKPPNLQSQIEFYFSDENLAKDSYLRSKMDAIGCCSIELIARFKRVTDFAQDQGKDPESAVADAVRASRVLESLVSDGKLCIRRTGPYNYRDLTEKVAKLAVKSTEPLNGKNFRSGINNLPATCAPGHKTAMGIAGRNERDDMKRKKAEKLVRKQLQAAREEANRARREAEEGPLSQTKRQWPGAVAPAASEPAAGGANDEEAEVEEGEVKAADKEEEAEGADRAPAQAEPEAEAGANGAKAPKKARKERRQGQLSEDMQQRGAFRMEIIECCRTCNFPRAKEVLARMQAAGVAPDAQQLCHVVNLCASFLAGDPEASSGDEGEEPAAPAGGKGGGGGGSKGGPGLRAGALFGAEEARKEGEAVLALAAGTALTENLATGMVRLGAVIGDLEGAMELVEQMGRERLARKRRTYGPLLAALAAPPPADPAAAAVALARAQRLLRDSQAQGADLLEEDFANIIRVCGAAEDAEGLWGTLESMAELIYAVGPATAAALTGALERVGRRAEAVGIGAGARPEEPAARRPAAAAGGVVIGGALPEAEEGGGGRCERCGEAVRSLELTPAELEAMCAQIEGLAVAPGQMQAERFRDFLNWMHRNGPPDVVIDGANVGYYNLRPDLGETLSYQQVDRVLQHLEGLGMKALVVMHCRHFIDKAPMSAAERAMTKRWRDRKVLYTTPAKMNDDWFWLYAGVWSTLRTGRVYMVSNDQMRDHHFQMLSTRGFLKWRERHWVNFHLPDKSPRSAPVFAFPSPFSVRMQSLPDARDRWHVPLADAPGRWLCCAKL